MEECLGPGHIVLDGDRAPPPPKGAQPPTFLPILLWPNGRPCQQLLSSCMNHLSFYDGTKPEIKQGCQHPRTGQRAATCFQWGSVPVRSDIKVTELPSPNILILLERQLIALQLCR